jgi:hypothetical protein
MNAMKLHEAPAEIERDIERLDLARQNRIRAAEGLRALLAEESTSTSETVTEALSSHFIPIISRPILTKLKSSFAKLDAHYTLRFCRRKFPKSGALRLPAPMRFAKRRCTPLTFASLTFASLTFAPIKVRPR